jgi:hypothetical protein
MAPDQTHVLGLTIGALEGRNAGKPSAWSTTIDQLAAGTDAPDMPKRLFVVAAGNTTREEPSAALSYPESNRRLAIHNPAQSWNALTVGAYSRKATLSRPGLGTPIAPAGGLSPVSATSIIWDDNWPLKPDVVYDGGNYVIDPSGIVNAADDLQLLTTGSNHLQRPLTLTGDTSAAAILGARDAARLQAIYPQAWPETVRGLIVHSAQWRRAMVGDRDVWDLKEWELRELLRSVGYGIPKFPIASASSDKRVTLIFQDSLQPYHLADDNNVATYRYKRHPLPWPSAVLQELLETPVTLRVTLSYFVDPNPGPRDVNNRYRYPGAALRFDLRRARESETQFAKRTSSQAELAPTDPTTRTQESGQWLIGRLAERGSLHHDIWKGQATDLATRDSIHVFPTTGWWRYRKQHQRYNNHIRYSLIVTLETPPQSADIYTPISAAISAMLRTPVAAET